LLVLSSMVGVGVIHFGKEGRGVLWDGVVKG